MKNHDTIAGMWRTIQMWRLIHHLHDVCLGAESRDVKETPSKDYISENRFLVYTALEKIFKKKMPLAYVSENLPCPGCDYDGFMKEIGAGHADDVKRKMAFYRELLRLAKRDGYVDEHTKEDGGGVIHVTDSGHELTGFADLVELLFKKYKLTWTLFLAPIVTFILGISIGS